MSDEIQRLEAFLNLSASTSLVESFPSSNYSTRFNEISKALTSLLEENSNANGKPTYPSPITAILIEDNVCIYGIEWSFIVFLGL